MPPTQRSPQPRDRTRATGESHAVVIGASIAGLLAARALARYFARVTMIDRDWLVKGPELRVSTPQSLHAHGLLARGHRVLEELLPGLDAELAEAGAPAGDVLGDAAILFRTGWLPRFRSGITSRSCSRAFLEACIRRRVLADSKIRILDSRKVVGLIGNRNAGKVEGVRLMSSHAATQQDESVEALNADFVVDASGSASAAPQWLGALGFPAPRETVVNAFFGYASRRYRQIAKTPRDWKVLLIYGQPPDHPRGGVIYPEEGGHWAVSLFGAARDYPPTDEEGFLQFASSLRSPVLLEAIQSAEPASPIRGFRRLENRLRHYEEVSPWPDRFLVLGDAVCTLNPVYGQGVTMCALHALALDECLRDQSHRTNRDFAGVAQSFQKRLANINENPWLIATCEDSRFLGPDVPRSWRTRWQHWYTDAALAQATDNREIALAFAEVYHLLKSPRTLLQTKMLARVLRRRLFGKSRPDGQDFRHVPKMDQSP